MREVIGKVLLDGGTFEVRVDQIKRSRGKPQHSKVVRAYIDMVQGGHQVKMYTTLDRQMTDDTYIGDVYATYEEALPTLAGVFLGVLAAHEAYGDDIIGYLAITSNAEQGMVKEADG